MKEFLKTFAAVVLGTALVLLAGFFLILGSLSSLIRIGADSSLTSIPERAVLHISFEEGISTQDSDLPVLGFLPDQLDIARGGKGFLSIAQAIRQAATDPSIRMIYLDPQALNAQMSHIEEIRNALLAFRQSGKPVISYAGTYSQQAYYLATAADKIVINPFGTLMLQGFSMEVNYYKDFFDKLGLEAQLVRHGNYKTAGEPFTSASMSREEKKQLHAYMTTAWEHWETNMETMRHLEKGTIDNLCNTTFLLDATHAREAGLADELWYRDDMLSYLSGVYDGLAEHKIPFLPVKQYIRYLEYAKQKPVREKIAIVYIKGEIAPKKGAGVFAADACTEQLDKFRRDSSIKAVVVRIESPGGDPIASDMIARQLELIKEVKPVVVSMGDMAASGGYWVASASHEIFVQPFTMTGSIGVYSLYFNVESAMKDKLGIYTQTITTHPFGNHFSLYHSKSKDELQVVQRSIDGIYNKFTDVVAQNRNMSKEEVEALADGRIWSGAGAVENGLADTIGGLTEAIERAAQLAGITQYRLVSYPRPLKITDMIRFSGEKVSIGAEGLVNPLLAEPVLTLLKERGIRARLPFDEKALCW